MPPQERSSRKRATGVCLGPLPKMLTGAKIWEIHGNPHVKGELSCALATGGLPHAYTDENPPAGKGSNEIVWRPLSIHCPDRHPV